MAGIWRAVPGAQSSATPVPASPRPAWQVDRSDRHRFLSPTQFCYLQIPALQLNNERFLVPELIFRPSNMGIKQAGLAEACMEAANAVHPDLRPLLFSNVLCVGGTSSCPGFATRLAAELRPLVPCEYEVRIFFLRRFGPSGGYSTFGWAPVLGVWCLLLAKGVGRGGGGVHGDVECSPLPLVGHASSFSALPLLHCVMFFCGVDCSRPKRMHSLSEYGAVCPPLLFKLWEINCQPYPCCPRSIRLKPLDVQNH